MNDEPIEIEIDGDGSKAGVTELAKQLVTFMETLEGNGTRYEFEATIEEIEE